MKFKIIALLLFIAILSGCGGATEQATPEAPVPPVSDEDRSFFYQDTKWGMTIEEITAIRGEPDQRSDMPDYSYLGEDAPPEGYWDNAQDETQLVDFYYIDKTFFDKYTGSERFLFDITEKLEGVTLTIDSGTLEQDLSNLDEITANTEAAFLDLRELMTGLYGEPNAEYTAYLENGEYKTEEALDIKKEGAVVCASRWDGDKETGRDGDNRRFLYIVYNLNDQTVNVRYTYHSQETIDRIDAEAKQ